MKKVNTLDELRLEKVRLHLQRVNLEAQIAGHFSSVKKLLKPAQMVKEGAENALFSKNRGLVYDMVGIVSNALIRNLILKNKNFLVRLIVPILVRNTVNNLIHDNQDKIISWFGGLLTKHTHNGHDKYYYDRSTASIED